MQPGIGTSNAKTTLREYDGRMAGYHMETLRMNGYFGLRCASRVHLLHPQWPKARSSHP